MFWLGLLLAVAYVPGYTGASVPTQWAVLSIILPLGLWLRSPYTLGHKLFFGFAAYGLISVAFSANMYSAIWGLWLLALWALSYHFGSLLDDLSGLWKGLAVGLFVSVAIAVAQAFDAAPVAVNEFQIAGLFFNSSLFGIILSLVIVGLACHRLWWYMPPLGLGLVLSGSRGGLLLVLVGLVTRFVHPLAALACLTLGAMIFAFGIDPADSQRLQIWGVTLSALSPLGHGPGSFLDLYYVRHTKALLIHPEYVHNDILQLVYEYGIGAVLMVSVPALALVAGRRNPEFPVLAAWATCACFYFPLYTPVTAFIGLVVAGHCMRDWARIRAASDLWRSAFLPWSATPRSGAGSSWRQALPFLPRTPHSEGAK